MCIRDRYQRRVGGFQGSSPFLGQARTNTTMRRLDPRLEGVEPRIARPLAGPSVCKPPVSDYASTSHVLAPTPLSKEPLPSYPPLKAATLAEYASSWWSVPLKGKNASVAGDASPDDEGHKRPRWHYIAGGIAIGVTLAAVVGVVVMMMGCLL
eukprot:TRINITY_DN755_c0_g2_i6.p2 TRINITY_DN755_c0_g2~~TRINITY_DN755_c0_g2_i6.p2  ORF type:complete len:153 (+),score=11.29 TRINITY_DN755_c0_g2_i6:164-622(+)